MLGKTPLMGHTKTEKSSDFRKVLNDSLGIFFKDALRVTFKNPLQAYFFLKTIRWQRKAVRLRAKWKRQDIHVPPIMIFSITGRCNLHCKGCYHQALRELSQSEMSDKKLKSIISEANELGISFVILGGGEPLVRREILEITKCFPEIIFLIFTNGLLINENIIAKIKKQRNVVPVISMEGYEQNTDLRRGKGVYQRLQGVIERLNNHSLFWSTSLTITKSNFSEITDENFIQDLVGKGCKLFFFVEYTPITEGTEDWVITDEQRASLIKIRDTFRSKWPALFIVVPGDEEEIGGCLSAGRGFVHISTEGNAEPCPFAPYSDTNLRDSSLKEALQSEFLKAMRENPDNLNETEGGCVLWVKHDWVRSLLHTE